MRLQKYLKEFKTKPQDVEILVNKIARTRAHPMEKGGKTIAGDIFYSDISHMVSKMESNPNDRYKLFQQIVAGLQKRGFWVHS
jgi:hypothetical protein